MSEKLLIIDGYDKAGRENLGKAGCTLAGTLYEQMIKRFLPDASVTILHPADPDEALPAGADLTAFDAALWTGSSLTIYHQTPDVTRQVNLARALYTAGTPSFGSCWALQIAALAAGGTCRLNPKGREFGIARKISLTPEGRSHPLYAGKASVFDGFTSHFDDVESLPSNSIHLAGNHITPIQAAIVTQEGTPFWAVQYHPEYDLAELAALTRFRMDGLVESGYFADHAAARSFVKDLEALHKDPTRKDIAWHLGIDQDVMDADIRTLEVKNWIENILRNG
ncbi:MAG: type 1 glutamine amidotransferase [Rhodobiaceae bacterium]|nr:type 1 glutamine amidotransferase [Rhodobiaceae bacterium]